MAPANPAGFFSSSSASLPAFAACMPLSSSRAFNGRCLRHNEQDQIRHVGAVQIMMKAGGGVRHLHRGQRGWLDTAGEVLGDAVRFGERQRKSSRGFRSERVRVSGIGGTKSTVGGGSVRGGGGVEFSTMCGGKYNDDLTAIDAVIEAVRNVDAGGRHVEIQVDVAGTGLENGHVRPGQFVQMERRGVILGRGGKRSFLTIANAPGKKKCFHFLVAKGSDPAGFSRLKKGDKVRLSPVIGEGVDFGDAIQSPNILLFVDCPQGLAAVRSLLEWNKFRAASGQGANRTTRVKLYYNTSGPGAVAYRAVFSEWMAYGVDVLPIYANTLLDHFGAVDVLGEMGHLGNTLAFASVAAKETVDYLYKILSFGGIQRSAIKSFTQDRVSNEVFAFVVSAQWIPPNTNESKGYREAPDSFYEYRRMRDLEEEIWQEWVRIRDAFRDEAYRRMATPSPFDPFDPGLSSSKNRAWSSWFMHNKEEWQQELWEDDIWGEYWESWSSNRKSWVRDFNFAYGSSSKYDRNWDWWGSTSRTGNHSNWGAAGQSWYTEKSQEYWEWVGHGTQGYGSAGASSGGDYARTYEDMYGGSTSWGNENNQRTHYEPGGYKYNWDPSGGQYKDTTSSQRSERRTHAGNSTGSGWSGWNRSSNRQKSSGGSNYYSSTNKVSLNIDFYALLGVPSNANKIEIKKAYRRAAMKWHPDRNPNSEEALAKMKEIVVAYTVLKDPAKRRDYDNFGIAK